MARRSGLRQRQKKKRGLPLLLALFVAGVLAIVLKMVGIEPVESIKNIFSPGFDRSLEDEYVRGNIYDRKYKRLAESLERVSVYARTRELQSIDDAVSRLAPLTGESEQELLTQLKRDALRVWLARDISQDQEEAIKELNLPGVYLHKEYSRYYPQKLTAAHLVGFVQDDIGLAGAEFYYDRLEQQMLSEVGGQNQIGAGLHVRLTLDLKVQEILERIVRRLRVGRQDVRIGAYAMDAGNGAIIAGVQYPSFNPNNYRIYSQDVLRNLLVEPMLVPPLYRRILRCSAGMQHLFETSGALPPWSISAANSSLGAELRLWNSLGLEEPAPADFGNSRGQTSPVSEIFVLPGQLNEDFGTVPEQAIPLNLMKAFGGLLNGGVRLSPYLAQAVVDPATNQEYQLRPEAALGTDGVVVLPALSSEIAKLVGSAGKFDELGGATLRDSVQVVTTTQEGFRLLNSEVILAILPADRAGLVVLITVQGGSSNMKVKPVEDVVDPVAELSATLPRLAVLQQIGKSIAGVAEPEDGENVNYPVGLQGLRDAVREPFPGVTDMAGESGRMPALVGLSLRKSLRLLQGVSCDIQVFGTGRVVAQKPAAGDPLDGVEECVLRLQRQGDVSLEALEEKLSEQ